MQTKVFTFWSARSNHGQTLGKVSSPFASLFFQICASMRDDSTLISLSLCVCRVILWYASLASSHDALGARHKMQPH